MPIVAPTPQARQNGKNAPEVEREDLGLQVARLREDLAELSRAVSAYGAATAGKAEHDLTKASQQAIDTVRSEVTSLEQNLRSRIRDNPLQAIGIAAGIGFIAALLARH